MCSVVSIYEELPITEDREYVTSFEALNAQEIWLKLKNYEWRIKYLCISDMV